MENDNTEQEKRDQQFLFGQKGEILFSEIDNDELAFAEVEDVAKVSDLASEAITRKARAVNDSIQFGGTMNTADNSPYTQKTKNLMKASSSY